MEHSLALTPVQGGVRLEVQVTPRASRSRVLGVHDGALKVSLKAPPVDGAANQELVRFLAKALGASKRDVELVRGHTARRKTVEIRGDGIEARLAALCG